MYQHEHVHEDESRRIVDEDEDVDVAGKPITSRRSCKPVPTLLLGGDRSQPAERRVLDKLVRALPNAKLHVFAELGHMGPITHASLVNTAIAAHIDSVARQIRE